MLPADKPLVSITEVGDSPVQMPIDSEHIGIRTLMPLLAIAGLVGGFVLGSIIAPMIDEALSGLCVSLFMAVIGLLVVTQLGERLIKSHWTSGREVEVDRSQLALVDKRRRDAPQLTLRWHEGVGIYAWYFIVPTRRSRVPKGWYCTAIRLVQGEQQMILYAFLSPEVAHSLTHFTDWFVHLHNKKEREQMSVTDVRASAEQERFRRLESHRWFDGAELNAADFLAVMQLVDRHGYLASSSLDPAFAASSTR